RFKDHDLNVDLPPFANSYGLCALNRDSLETPVPLDKVEIEVWGCGSSKDPGPSGFSFGFVMNIEIILKLTFWRVHYKNISKILGNRLTKVIDKIVSHEQTTFLAGRKTLDGPFIPSEIVEWLKKEEKIVNLQELDYPHLGLWFSSMVVLPHNYLSNVASGKKYNVYGIGVSDVDVSSMASNSGCASRSFPFTYLGLPIGPNMSLTSSWKVLLDRFQSKLSSWKANLLSIGGRHTLIKAIFCSLGIYYFSIFKVPASVLNSLEISRAMFFGSLKAFHPALLQKWRWRLLSHKNTLWVKVIKALHGQEGGFDNNGCIYNGTSAEINEVEDTCVWSLGTDGTFSVKDARCIIDLKILLSLAPSTVFLERRSIVPHAMIKMRTLLIQHECEAALEVLPEDMEAEAKPELNKKAHNVVILCLANKVLREVTGETTIVEVWSKLKDLYMTNSLANRLDKKKKLYTFYMPVGRKNSDHIDESKKIILDLEHIKVKFEDEYLAFLLLTSLPASYKHFVNTYLYGREALTLKDVVGTLNSKEIKKRSNAKGDNGEGLYDNLKRNCQKNNYNKSTGYVMKDDQPSSSGSIYVGSQDQRYWQGKGITERWVKFCVTLSGLAQKTGTYQRGGTTSAGKARVVWKKEYRLDDESLKKVTSRNVVFNESVIYKGTLKDSNEGTDKSVKEITAEEEDTHEPLTYQEAVACKESSRSKASMKEKTHSVRNNKTWE
nr:retrovirus-related Pol polyprotein from transposon TNT 1-94 [Tanacetum cinerariifolium]GEW72808.1 retrovirus-related Pol polyprotein from transposon TNT 1-94 [Tanacetum cinerariifolium]